MKKLHRVLSALFAISILFCGIFSVYAATGFGDDGAAGTYAAVPTPEMGGEDAGYMFRMTAEYVTDFLESNGKYIGRTYLSGTQRFGYTFRLYHSLASNTHNYAMRGGICYYSAEDGCYVPLSKIDVSTNGEVYTGYIARTDFEQDRIYRGFVKNLMSTGYVYGTLVFFRELS